MTRKLLPACVCLALILSSVGTLAGGINPSEETLELKTLGGLWNPDGPTESATTHIVRPDSLLAANPGPLPAAVDNSAGLPPVGNQLSQGSCTCWAIGYYHATYIENRESPFDLADPANQVSPAFLYNVANGGYNGGSYMEDVADLIISNGACSMAEMPYNTYDYNSWPSEDWIWVSGMKRKAASQNWLYVGNQDGMDALKAYIAAGNTATTGISVWSNFDNIENFNNTYASSERYGSDRGGHIVTICGYDDDMPTADGNGAFRMVNSWGTNWGDSGYWWMTYEALVDGYLGYSWIMYLESELDYSPSVVAKLQISHPERGDIVSNYGLEVSLSEDSVQLATKNLLCCPWIEDWYSGEGDPVQELPFPEGTMAFDISEFLSSMNRSLNHQFILTLDNSEDINGELLSMEILNPEWWEGDISWETPLDITPYSVSQTDTWVDTGLFLHNPIRINDDIEFAHRAIGEFWEGNGSESNPYIIHDYYVWGENAGCCIYVGNTTSHFTVAGCTAEYASGYESADYYLDTGIHLNNVTDARIDSNTALISLMGIFVLSSQNVTVAENRILENLYGLWSAESENILILGNNVSGNIEYGIINDMCAGNAAYHNTIADNGIQAYDDSDMNSWDGGYPSGGNYWGDYSGPDTMSGPLQDQPGSDEIGDTPYTDIDSSAGAQDRYPLMEAGALPNPPTFGRSLTAGWNFVSLPTDLGSPGIEIEAALSSINGSWNAVKYFDSFDASDPWKTYRPGGQFNDLARINQAMGFWVHVTENCSLLSYELMPESTSINLRAGWNMVGYPTLTERVMSDALWGTSADRVEVFDPTDPELLRVMGQGEYMMPGQGYWVHVVADTVWTVDW